MKDIIREELNDMFTSLENERQYDTGITNTDLKNMAERIEKAINLSLGDVRLCSILKDRLESHKDSYKKAWKDLTSESKYKKEDGIEPFYKLQRIYKTKAEEIQIILDLYKA